MYLLDTNVISELRRPDRAAPAVLAWTRAVLPEQMFICSVTVFELELGVRQKERRDAAQGAMLRRWLEERVLPQFEGRTLGIDAAVARRCAALHSPNPAPERDAWIAATALVHRMIVVSRNTRDFSACGAQVINPWSAQG